MSQIPSHRYLFVDAEFTGEHQHTTLVSLALVGEDDRELEVICDDFDRDQVTDWLRTNVLDHLDMSVAVPSAEAFRRVEAFVHAYGEGRPVRLVSAGKLQDLLLLFELWKHGDAWRRESPPARYFHYLRGLPSELNHAAHVDLNTMMMLAGVDPGANRAAFAGVPAGRRHSSLDDARVVKACFSKLRGDGTFPRFDATFR
ncbi:MAG: 3'-5' exoribonuclease [Polyangiaceae bacterium]